MGKRIINVLGMFCMLATACGGTSEPPSYASADGIAMPSEEQDAGMAQPSDSIGSASCVAEEANIHATLAASWVVLFGWSNSVASGATIVLSDNHGLSKTGLAGESGSFSLFISNENVVRGDKLSVTVSGDFCQAKKLEPKLLLPEEISQGSVPACYVQATLVDARYNGEGEVVVFGWHDSVEYHANVTVANRKGYSVRVKSNGEGRFSAVLPFDQYAQIGENIYVIVSTDECLSPAMAIAVQ